MVKRILLPALAASAIVAMAAMPAARAGVMLNGVMLNGSGPGGEVAFQPVRLTLPDGAELTFR